MKKSLVALICLIQGFSATLNSNDYKIWKRQNDFLVIEKVDENHWQEVGQNGTTFNWELFDDTEEIGQIVLYDNSRKAFMRLTSKKAYLKFEGDSDFAEWSSGEWLHEPSDFNKKLLMWTFLDYPNLFYRKLNNDQWIDDEGKIYSVDQDNKRVGEIILFTSSGYNFENEWKKLTPDHFYFALDESKVFEKSLEGKWFDCEL